MANYDVHTEISQNSQPAEPQQPAASPPTLDELQELQATTNSLWSSAEGFALAVRDLLVDLKQIAAVSNDAAAEAALDAASWLHHATDNVAGECMRLTDCLDELVEKASQA
jgi:hypothetical protein